MRPIAYEFICLETGHCYVDYIRRIDIEAKGDIYVQRSLYYELIDATDLMELFEQNPSLLDKFMLELRKKKLEKLTKK